MSTTSPLERDSRPLLPILPPEIKSLIVKTALGPYDAFHWRDVPQTRLPTLKKFLVLDSDWRAICRRHWYEWVVIRSAEDVVRFLAASEEAGGTIPEVLTMRIEWFRWGRFGVRLLLKYIPNVRNLLITTSSVDAEPLAGLQHLTRLRLKVNTVAFPSPPRQLCLPRLRYLEHLGMPIDDPSIPLFLCPEFLPQLRQLVKNFGDLYQHEYEEMWAPVDPHDITPLIEQVEALQSDEDHGDDSRYPALAKSLRLLSLRRSFYSIQTYHLKLLPRLPPFLLLDYDHNSTCCDSLDYLVIRLRAQKTP